MNECVSILHHHRYSPLLFFSISNPLSKSKGNLFLVITSIQISRGISASTTSIIIFINMPSRNGIRISSLPLIVQHPSLNLHTVGKYPRGKFCPECDLWAFYWFRPTTECSAPVYIHPPQMIVVMQCLIWTLFGLNAVEFHSVDWNFRFPLFYLAFSWARLGGLRTRSKIHLSLWLIFRPIKIITFHLWTFLPRM